MKLLPSKSIPGWQMERAKIVLSIFQHRIKPAIQRGEKISRAIRRASSYYHGRPYKSVPSRRLALAPGTLRHLWYVWQSNGENPSAIHLNYKKRPPYVQRSLMVQFLLFCSSKKQRSVKAAWQKFSNMRRNSRLARGISYGMVRYHFRATDFYQLKIILHSRDRHQARTARHRAAFENVKLKLRAAELRNESLIRSELERVKARIISDLTRRLQ
jgi:hypothetical protein